MANSHIQPSMMAEMQANFGDLLAPAILYSTLTTPGSGMTLPAFTTSGYVRNGTPTRLVYVNQPAAPVTIAGGAGAYWLALMHDTHSAVAGWTRQAGTHYCWQAAATQPADPPGGLVIAQITVAGGSITVADPNLTYTATRVAYGAGTGGLAFDKNLTWDGSAQVLHVYGTAEARRHTVYDHAGDGALAFYTTLNAAGGANRWAIYTAGDAPSFLGGALTVNGATTLSSTLTVQAGVNAVTLGVTGAVNLYSTLTVASNTHLNGLVGIGGVPDGGYWLRVYGGTYLASLTVGGDAWLQSHTGIGAVPLPSQFHLNAGLTQLYSLNVVTTMGVTGAAVVGNGLSVNGGNGYFAGVVGIQAGPNPSYSLAIGGQVYIGSHLTVVGAVYMTDPATTRVNLGLGTMATQNYDNVYITAGTANLASLGVAGGSNLSGLVTVGQGVNHPNVGGNNVVSFYSTLAAAGGSNRWFIRQDGDAPSFHVGPVAIYANATLSNYHLYIGYLKQNNYGLVFRPTDNDTGGGYAIRFMSQGGAEVGGINTTGANTQFLTASDVRLKRDIVPLADALDVIQALKPVSHRWKVDDSLGVSFLAHEVAEVVEGIVTGEHGMVDAEGNIQPQCIDYSKLMPYVVGGLKEVLERLKRLEERA